MGMEHRKVNKRIRFTDAQGNALQNSEIKVSQTNHKFLFGCGAFDFIPYVAKGEEKNKDLTETWLEIFNYGTLPFY